MAGMKTILALAFCLASGGLLVILSCALFNNWYPLFVVLAYSLAPIPNIITKRISSGRDLLSDETKGIAETGYFLTSFFLVSGIALPVVLYHSEIIIQAAMIMSLIGGSLIYLTILGYFSFFVNQDDQVYLY